MKTLENTSNTIAYMSNGGGERSQRGFYTSPLTRLCCRNSESGSIMDTGEAKKLVAINKCKFQKFNLRMLFLNED